HRDCYICHFLLHLPFSGKEEELKISVIDLHRSQLRTLVPRRWRDKVFLRFYFSSMKIGLTQRDIWWIMNVYCARPLKRITKKQKSLLSASKDTAEKTQEKKQK
ncbi:lipopolysaccharide kinase InaA family protein, partial [Escherichia coli]|uniref:lipopolysaccharide kinase InaA family protein n=1 Tax=Escherichia coli TaxID=562 RepID=UPI0024E09D0E